MIKNYDVFTAIEDKTRRHQGNHKTVALGLDFTIAPDASKSRSSLTFEASKTEAGWEQEAQDLGIDYGLLYSYSW